MKGVSEMKRGKLWGRAVGGFALSVAVACSLGIAVPVTASAEDAVVGVVVLGEEPDQAVPLEVEEPLVELMETNEGEQAAQGATEATDDETGDVEVQASGDASSTKGITVDGKAYGGAKSGSGRDGGTWSWDGAGNLVLDGYRGGSISTDGAVLNVELRGTNVISKFHIDPASDYWGYSGLGCLYFDGETSVKVFGSGSLKIDAGEVSYQDVGHNFGMYGISADRVSIEGARVTIDLSKVTGAAMGGSMALSGTDIRITKGSKVVAKGGKEEAKMMRGAIEGTRISIIDSTVKASAPKGSIGGSIFFSEELRIENSVVDAPYSPQSNGYAIFTNIWSVGEDHIARVINSDVTTHSFLSGKLTLKSVTGATVESYEEDYLSYKYLKPASGSAVSLVHTGAASAYENGVGHSSAKSLSSASVKLPAKSYAYSGKARKPQPVVRLGSKALSAGTDYVVSYKSNKSVGTATVTVTGTGAYSGSAKATFKIVPKGTKVSKLKAGKGALTVSWKRQATQASGYQLQYTAKKSFSGAKSVTVRGSGTTTRKISGLTRGKAYRVRVRTWKKVGSKTYYSSWSAAKSVKTK